jgi:ribosome-binding protein aMBF1 (putative translation factor)
MPSPDTGVNNVPENLTETPYRTQRRPNPVFSDEYGVVRDVLIGARRDAGLSQRALAARLGKTGSHVAMIERGQRRVDLLEFCRIAESLGISADALVGRISAQLGALREAA